MSSPIEKTHLQKLKECFKEIGIAYKEHVDEDGSTLISMCNPNDVNLPLNEHTDSFIEFDENGELASY